MMKKNRKLMAWLLSFAMIVGCFANVGVVKAEKNEDGISVEDVTLNLIEGYENGEAEIVISNSGNEDITIKSIAVAADYEYKDYFEIVSPGNDDDKKVPKAETVDGKVENKVNRNFKIKVKSEVTPELAVGSYSTTITVNYLKSETSKTATGKVTVNLVNKLTKDNFSITAPSFKGESDGKIEVINVDIGMLEYSQEVYGDFTNCLTDDKSNLTKLTAGTYYFRYKNFQNNASNTISCTISDGPERTYELKIGEITFDNLVFNYDAITSKNIKITNSGNSDATIKKIKVMKEEEGTKTEDDSVFEIKEPTNNSDKIVPANEGGENDKYNDKYEIKPKSGLSAGTYTREVQVIYDADKVASANVSLTVEKAESENKLEVKNLEVKNPEFEGENGYVSGNDITLMEYRKQEDGQNEDDGWISCKECGDGKLKLKAGTYEIRYRAKDNNHKPSNSITIEIMDGVTRNYVISIGKIEFSEKIYEYKIDEQNDIKPICITNGGNSPVKIVGIAVEELKKDEEKIEDKKVFEITEPTEEERIVPAKVDNIDGKNENYKIEPKEDLDAGTYTRNLKVKYIEYTEEKQYEGDVKEKSIEISFKVDKKEMDKTPDNLTSEPTSRGGASDGIIKGVSQDMEYINKEDGEKNGEYISCTSDTVSGLKAGTYWVRYKAKNENYIPGKIKEIEVESRYSIIYYDNDGTVMNENFFNGSYPVIYMEGDGTVLPIPKKTGYIFEKWIDKNTNKEFSMTNQTTGNLELVASWLEVSLTLKADNKDPLGLSKEGKSKSTTITVEGAPNRSGVYVWYKEGIKIKETTEAYIELKISQAEKAEYRCIFIDSVTKAEISSTGISILSYIKEHTIIRGKTIGIKEIFGSNKDSVKFETIKKKDKRYKYISISKNGVIKVKKYFKGSKKISVTVGDKKVKLTIKAKLPKPTLNIKVKKRRTIVAKIGNVSGAKKVDLQIYSLKRKAYITPPFLKKYFKKKGGRFTNPTKLKKMKYRVCAVYEGHKVYSKSYTR